MNLAAQRPDRSELPRSRAASRPSRILVADDDGEFRGLVAEALRTDGYDVVEEGDGGRLLVRVAAIYSFGATADPIDLIVSDYCMPICSGLDILKGLRSAHWTTPFILMTGFGDDDLFASAAHLGACVMRKPFAATDLLDRVRTLLST